MFEYFRDLVAQLQQVPGGPSALLKDYFTKAVKESLTDLAPVQERLCAVLGREVLVADAWALNGGGTLCLAILPEDGAQVVLLHENQRSATLILDLPDALIKAARVEPESLTSEYQVSPLVLVLLAIAMGGIDDKKRVVQVVPEVDYCAKGLLLIASCRLCG
jgi:hypothetical protein